MGKKILIIDDEVDILNLIKLRFEHLGYEILIALNKEEGLAKAKSDNPDLSWQPQTVPERDGSGARAESVFLCRL